MTKQEARELIDFMKLYDETIALGGSADHIALAYGKKAFELGWDACKKAVKEGVLKAENDKKDEAIPFKEIMDAVNAELGKQFKLTPMHKSCIRSRWTEGMRLEDFIRVCRLKSGQWAHDRAMAIYLRPETLFGTKMDAYNNEELGNNKKTTEDWQ